MSGLGSRLVSAGRGPPLAPPPDPIPHPTSLLAGGGWGLRVRRVRGASVGGDF